MLQGPSKFQSNALTHLLSLHNSSSKYEIEHNYTNLCNNYSTCDPSDVNQFSITENSVVSDGKSFTIAAILGLNSSETNSNRNFNNVVNLSFHQSQKKIYGNINTVNQSSHTVNATQNNNQHINSFQLTPPISALQNLQQLHHQRLTASSNYINQEKYRCGKYIRDQIEN